MLDLPKAMRLLGQAAEQILHDIVRVLARAGAPEGEPVQLGGRQVVERREGVHAAAREGVEQLAEAPGGWIDGRPGGGTLQRLWRAVLPLFPRAHTHKDAPDRGACQSG